MHRARTWTPQSPPCRRAENRAATLASRERDQPVRDGVDDELRRLVQAERIHDVRAVDGDRVDAEIELPGDFAIRQAGANELQHFELAWRQRMCALAFERRGP